MTLSRSPIKRKPSADAVLAAHRSGVDQFPGQLPRVRKGPPRRTEHPFPLPSGEPVTAADVREGEAFGPQAELCRSTVCAACFALWWARVHGKPTQSARIDWTQLPAVVGGQRSDPHHEPPRGTALASDDDDTLPLCRSHHTDGFVSRHGWGATKFYAYFSIDWNAALREMRRRTAMLTEARTTPCNP